MDSLGPASVGAYFLRCSGLIRTAEQEIHADTNIAKMAASQCRHRDGVRPRCLNRHNDSGGLCLPLWDHHNQGVRHSVGPGQLVQFKRSGLPPERELFCQVVDPEQRPGL